MELGSGIARPVGILPKASAPEDQSVPFGDIVGEIRQVLLFVTGFSLVINVLMLVGPIYMIQVYDRVLSSGSIPTLAPLYRTEQLQVDAPWRHPESRVGRVGGSRAPPTQHLH